MKTEPELLAVIDVEDKWWNSSAMERANKSQKRWEDYWRLPETQAFARAVSEETGIPYERLVWKSEDGDRMVHELIGNNFGQWLSPDCALWVSRRMWSLIETGKAER